LGNLTVFEQIFLEHLNYGVENAVTSKLLAHKFKVDRRRIMKTVSDMCRKGVPIVGTRQGRHKGYFLASDQYELQEYIKPLEAEYEEAMKRIKKLKALTSDDYKKVELTRKGVFSNDQ
jgi:predicted DNA-binding transcriptional regulator YafY